MIKNIKVLRKILRTFFFSVFTVHRLNRLVSTSVPKPGMKIIRSVASLCLDVISESWNFWKIIEYLVCG